MSYVFISSSHNYADEFDVTGCFVTSRTQLEADLEKIKKAFEDKRIHDGTEFYFGTNEALSFTDYASFEDGLTVKDCTEAFYNEFKALTGGGIGIIAMDGLLGLASKRYEK